MTNRTLNLTVGTTKKSIDTSSLTWLFRNAFHVGDGDLLERTRYFSTVDLATLMPSLRNPPTIRGEPQPTLAADISRINALISFDPGGLPAFPCLLNLAQ